MKFIQQMNERIGKRGAADGERGENERQRKSDGEWKKERKCDAEMGVLSERAKRLPGQINVYVTLHPIILDHMENKIGSI